MDTASNMQSAADHGLKTRPGTHPEPDAATAAEFSDTDTPHASNPGATGAHEAFADEPVLRLTRDAADHVRDLQSSKPENAGKPLRMYVEAGGCSGRQYGMTFDEKRDGDWCAGFFGVEVVVDAVSAEYLNGTVIDYVDSLNDGGFKMSNPKAKESCGCGRSFNA
jgi:iron-sulfur cluster assembly accessory protein